MMMIGLWAFTGCPFTSTVGYHTSISGATREITDLPVVAGTTYYFVISTWTPPESTDYTIEITKLPDCSGAPTAGTISGPTEICATVPFTLEMDNPIFEAGITYQWQSSPAGADTWADIAGADHFNHTMSDGITDATDFRLIVTCTNSNETDTSNVLTVTMELGTSCYCEPSYTYGCSSDNIRD